MKAKQTKTLKSKMLISMLAIVLLEGSIIIAVFHISHTADQLVMNSVQVFTNSISNKADEMKKQMLNWSDIADFQEQIDEIAHQLEEGKNESAGKILENSDTRQQFLRKATNLVLDNLRYTKANGSFIILDSPGSESKDAVYLRDVNPLDNPTNNKDILLLAGSSELMLQNDFTLDSIWTTRLPVAEDALFFHNPYQASATYPDIDAANLGYWAAPFRLKDNDAEIISYTRPLLDRDHHCYGIIGISISLDYLNKYLSMNAIGIDKEASYFMGLTEDHHQFHTILVNRNYYKARLYTHSTLELNKKMDSHRLYPVSIGGYDQKSLFFSTNLKLYNTNTPFEHEQWVLGGLIPSNILYAPSDRFNLALAISVLLAFTVSLTGGIFLTASTVKPLSGLARDIGAMKPYSVSINKTNIKEVDELVEKIEILSNEVYKAGSRVADILEISNLSLGICELEKDNQSIFCTKRFLEITNLTLITWENNYADMDEFINNIASFKEALEPEDEEIDIYHYQPDGLAPHWLHIRCIPSEKSTLVLIMDVTHDIEEKIKIKHDRDYDVLTDLFNRRAFSRMTEEILGNQEILDGVLSIWDLDNLKFINDTYGHDMGDKYICLMADIMKSNVRQNLICARMSGDEFMAFIYDEETETAFGYLEKIHQAFTSERLTLPDGGDLPVSVSAGMVSITESRDLKQLTRYADFAMYEIKKNAKGGIRRFDRESHLKNYILVQGVGELNHILSERRIRYAFQPIVDIREKKIYAYEALMRPESDMLGNPADFLRVAQAQSKLNQVETATWFNALEQYLAILDKMADARLFVNSIPNQVLSDSNLKRLENRFHDILHRIVLEVTEEVQLNASHELIKKDFCKRWNIMRALDDYGSGFSNTDRLVSDEFDFVKLDMSLIRDIHLYPDRQQLVGGMISYCHSKNIKVIAEGVEIKEELIEVMNLKADYVQGYYFAKPSFDTAEIPFDKFL